MQAAELFDRRLDMILLAGRHAARGDDQIVLGRGRGERVGKCSLAVGPDAKIGNAAAEAGEQGRQYVAVGVVDRARRQRRAGIAHLVAGRKQRHPQRAEDREFVVAEGRGEAEFGRAEPGPGGERYRARGDILARMTAVGALLDAGFEPHAAIGLGRAVLLHHDRVGTLGHRRAGEDADRLAAGDRPIERVPRCGAAGEPEHGVAVGEEVGMGEGVAIDRAVGVRRQVHPGDEIAGEDATGARPQRRRFDVDNRDGPRIDPVQGLVDRHQRATKGEAVVAQLGHRFSP